MSHLPLQERAKVNYDAPEAIAALRRAGFMQLSEIYRQRFAATANLTAEVEGSISDLQFTAAYRVPFQYRRLVRQYLNPDAFVQSSDGVTLTDLDAIASTTSPARTA